MTTLTRFDELMRLAAALGKAEKSGDKKAIEEARKAHDDYVAICLESDGILVGKIADLELRA